jgi:hypothetical protein
LEALSIFAGRYGVAELDERLWRALTALATLAIEPFYQSFGNPLATLWQPFGKALASLWQSFGNPLARL